LQKFVNEYDTAVERLQAVIDELEEQISAQEQTMEALEDQAAIVDERYEEMKATIRLKEILGEIQLMERGRENWAARRIQV